MTLDIDRLYVDAIDTKPITMSWDVETHEEYATNSDGITWSFTEAVKCDECERVLVGSGGYVMCEANDDPDENDTATCEHCDKPITFSSDYEWLHDEPAFDQDPTRCATDEDDIAEPKSCNTETLVEGPMMNYWYPVDIRDAEDAARKLIDISLCVVEVDGQTGLALTGGGMDMSWDIAEAFIVLGHYPPVHFSDLPLEATPLSEDRKQIVLATLKANDIARNWAQQRMDRLTKNYGIELPASSED